MPKHDHNPPPEARRRCACVTPDWRFCAPCREYFAQRQFRSIPALASITTDGLLPASINLQTVAEDVATLVELFHCTNPFADGELRGQLVNKTLQCTLRMQKEVRLNAAREGRDIEGSGLVSEIQVDAGCVICYSQIADTVLSPCNHLVLCTSCCDELGIKEKASPWRQRVKCPICRATVLDRIKIFRG